MNRIPKGASTSLRDQYEQVERAIGITPPELVGLPELPECAAHVWRWYHQVSATRQCGMTVNPITHQEIDAWGRLRGIRPLVWELEALFGIDGAFMAHIAEESKRYAPKK